MAHPRESDEWRSMTMQERYGAHEAARSAA